MLRRGFAIVTALAGAAIANAQDGGTDFTPARFVEGDRSLVNRIKFPKTDGDALVEVVCRGHATARGRMRDVRCSSTEGPERDFAGAVRKRLNSSRVEPATVNGEPQEVDFQFTIVFERVGQEESITAYLNNGHNVERLGRDYISPQRYSPHVWPSSCLSWRDNEVIIEIATVETSGRPSEVRAVTTRSRMVESCGASLTRQLEEGRWIPAMKDGEFVDAVWMSPIVLSLNLNEVEF